MRYQAQHWSQGLNSLAAAMQKVNLRWCNCCGVFLLQMLTGPTMRDVMLGTLFR